MRELSSDIARRLAKRAIDVCRHYLPNGTRVGDYWIAGDVRGAKGRSLFVRIAGPLSGKGAVGKWRDAATGEHGDLLDLITAACQFSDHRDARDEARRFLNETTIHSSLTHRRDRYDGVRAAQRLFAASQPVAGTLAETYLKARGLGEVSGLDALRFHPRCLYRIDGGTPPQHGPALIAAVTDEGGAVIGVMRTWLSRDGGSKAPLATPRKALGGIAGNAVRFGAARNNLIIGEGVETLLSLRPALPSIPLAAALSAQHLAMFRVPSRLKRLYIAVDRDEAGLRAAEVLRKRATDTGVDAWLLLPIRKDFNDDLVFDGVAAMTAALTPQLAVQDRSALRHIR